LEKKNKNLYFLTVLSVLTLEPALKFDYNYFRKQSGPFIRFDDNDSFGYRIINQILEIYETENFN
jgi:hypothetical protein